MSPTGLYPGGFAGVLVPVDQPVLTVDRPLPDGRVDLHGPPVNEPSDEPLVTVAGPRIDVIPVYADAELPGAVRELVVRATVLARLQAAARTLPDDIGLVVLDAWRSQTLQQALWQQAVAAGLADYVSRPSNDPRHPAPHHTGGTVDLTLSHEGRALALGSAFDEFTTAAHVDALETTEHPARDLRRLLCGALDDQGFVVHPKEWWHHEFGTCGWAGARGRAPLYGPVSPSQVRAATTSLRS